MFTNAEIGQLMAKDMPAVDRLCEISRQEGPIDRLCKAFEKAIDQTLTEMFYHEGTHPRLMNVNDPALDFAPEGEDRPRESGIDDLDPVESDSEVPIESEVGETTNLNQRWFFSAYNVPESFQVRESGYVTVKVWNGNLTFTITGDRETAEAVRNSLLIDLDCSTLHEEIPCSPQLYYEYSWVDHKEERTVKRWYAKFLQ